MRRFNVCQDQKILVYQLEKHVVELKQHVQEQQEEIKELQELISSLAVQTK